MMLDFDDFARVYLGWGCCQHDEDLSGYPKDGHTDSDRNEDVGHYPQRNRNPFLVAQILSMIKALAIPPPSHMACKP